jgi:hypothetical protein
MKIRKLRRATYLVPGELFHIELNSSLEIDRFLDWLETQDKYPFSIYLDGITYTFTEQILRDMFVIAFQAAKNHYDRI